MIPCPYCERGFEKRAGLMRHVTVAHPSEGVVPSNPGGAIEPLIPPDPNVRWPSDDPSLDVEPETYAESLDELAPGQEPYVDPPVEEWGVVLEAPGDVWHERSTVETPVRITMDDGPELGAALGPAPSAEQHKQIRALIRQGHTESEAWMTIVGTTPPPRPPQPVDGRPLRLQQVAFRVRNGGSDQIDALWLLRLADLGAEAIHHIDMNGLHADDVVVRWQDAIQ